MFRQPRRAVFAALALVIAGWAVAGARGQTAKPEQAPSAGQARKADATPVSRQACRERAVTTVDLTRCARADYRRQDSRLQAAVAEVRLRLQKTAGRAGTRRRKDFEASLKAWAAWRDAECDWRSDVLRGGTAEPLVRLRCLADLTRTQVAALRAETE